VNEAVDRLIAERQRLDQGLPGPLVVSLAAHATLVGLALALPLILPRGPLLRVADGFAVVLPRGGGGSPTVTSPPAAAPAPQPAAPVAPAPPPKVLKPPTEAPRPRALPLPDAHRSAKHAPEPVVAAAKPGPAARTAEARAGTPAGTGTASATPGLEFGPPGPGVPEGTDSGGDWYLAGVQQKIWMLWNQQIKSGFAQPIGVTFTILADGSVTGVRVTQPSGIALLDMAAQRAVLNAAPFGPLPRQYATTSRTIQAVFKPAS